LDLNKSCHSRGEARKSAGFGSRKERAAGTSKALILCISLVCKSNTSVYSLSQLEHSVGTWDFTFQIGHFWMVKPVPSQNPIHFLVVGTWVGGVRDPIQKYWIGFFFGTPGGDGLSVSVSCCDSATQRVFFVR
jgi:hypothetical protein